MTLDEAILHARDIAKSGCSECCKEHEQLADWLEELKKLRIVISKATELCCKCSDSSECPMLYPFLKEGADNG